jgi:hypothetical protein
MIGLPIPFLFAADIGRGEENEGRLEIVDGSQRIRSLAMFLENTLGLIGLKKLDELNGLTFSQLSLARQRRFKRSSLRLIQLEEETTEETRRDIFERINTGSTPLTDMEVRRGVSDGPFVHMVVELARDPLFNTLAPISEPAMRRREREEFVLCHRSLRSA